MVEYVKANWISISIWVGVGILLCTYMGAVIGWISA